MSSQGASHGDAGRLAPAPEMYAPLLHGEGSSTSALAASEQMLFSLMHSMTNAVFWKDRNSCYLGCNHVFSSFAGFDSSILLGKSDRDMPWADDPEFNSEWFIDWDHAVLDTGEPKFGILERLRRADGEERWIETNKVPLARCRRRRDRRAGNVPRRHRPSRSRGRAAADPRRPRRTSAPPHERSARGPTRPCGARSSSGSACSPKNASSGRTPRRSATPRRRCRRRSTSTP